MCEGGRGHTSASIPTRSRLSELCLLSKKLTRSCLSVFGRRAPSRGSMRWEVFCRKSYWDSLVCALPRQATISPPSISCIYNLQAFVHVIAKFGVLSFACWAHSLASPRRRNRKGGHGKPQPNLGANCDKTLVVNPKHPKLPETQRAARQTLNPKTKGLFPPTTMHRQTTAIPQCTVTSPKEKKGVEERPEPTVNWDMQKRKPEGGSVQHMPALKCKIGKPIIAARSTELVGMCAEACTTWGQLKPLTERQKDLTAKNRRQLHCSGCNRCGRRSQRCLKAPTWKLGRLHARLIQSTLLFTRKQRQESSQQQTGQRQRQRQRQQQEFRAPEQQPAAIQHGPGAMYPGGAMR